MDPDNMKDIPLQKYMKGTSQKEVAGKLGVTPGAIYQMIRDDRNIFVRVSDTGSVIAAYEIRQIGSIRSVSRPADPELVAA